MHDPREVFLYHFNNNDPVNKRKPESMKKYMNQFSDWLEMFNIESPEHYFHEGGGIFGRSSMEHDIQFDFGRSLRRPQLWKQIKSAPQLFGPNIVFSVEKSDNMEIQSSVRTHNIAAASLQGAGTVEQIIASLLNESKFLSLKDEVEDPLKLNFIMVKHGLDESHENIIRKSLVNFRKTIHRSENESRQYFLDFQIRHCNVTFWFGFDMSSSSYSDIAELFLQRTRL